MQVFDDPYIKNGHPLHIETGHLFVKILDKMLVEDFTAVLWFTGDRKSMCSLGKKCGSEESVR